jgi:hypothetical protein
MLGCLLHAPRGPFYSPKAARSRWRPTRKANLAFCRVAHRTVRCTTGQPLFMSGARFPSIHGAVDRCNFGLVGAPDSPVPPADRWRGPRVARGLRSRPLRWRPLAHRTVRCTTGQSGAPPDSPVNYSHTPSSSPESGWFNLDSSSAPDTVWCTIGQSGAPRPSSSWLYTTNSFPIYFLLFLSLRHNTLVPKSMY